MFSSKAPPYALYSRLMRSRDRGDALWDPSPDVVLDERGERREDPVVQVGHVGYRQEGKWRHILDIHRPRDEQLYPELIPLEGFQVLPRRFISSHDPESPIHFTPKSRTSFAIETSCSSVGMSASGPSLRFSLDSEASLTYFGRSQRDQIRKPDVGRYKEYAVRNLRHWASLVSSNGWTLDVDELSIVTDRTLAPSWVNSVQSEKTAGAQIGAQVYVNGAASGGFSVSFQSTSTTGLVTKYGPFSRLSALPPPAESESAKFYPPRHDDPAVAGPLDQCLFIKSVRAADRSILEKSLSRLAPLVFESRKASKDPPGLSRRDYSASTSQDGSSPASSNGFYGGSGGTPLTEDYGSDALPEVDDDDFDSYFSPEADEIYDVGKHALRYILKESGSDVAVFHDDDISPFAEELASYENASTFFETHSLHVFSYRYDGCTIGSLSELDFGALIAHPVSYSASLGIPTHVKQELVESYPTPNYSDPSTPPSNLPLHAKKEEYEDNNIWIKSSRSPWVKTEWLGGDFTASISPRNVNQNLVKKEELGDVEMRSLREPPPDECSSTPSLHISSNKWLGTSTAHVSLHALPTPPPSYCEDPVPLPVKRKRGHASTWGDDSEDSNLSGDDDNRASNPPAIRNTPKRRMPGACTYCRRVKMKCEFSPGSQTCKRCYAGNHHCVVDGRKPRTAPSKREYLLAQLRQKDGIIESLLKQLHHPRTPQSADSAGSSTVADWTEGLSEDTLSWLNQPQASRSQSFPSPGDSVLPEANASSKEELVRGAWIHDYGGMHPIFPETASPLGLLANLSFGIVKRSWPGHFKKRTNPGDGFNDEPAGAASLDYFIPGPSLDLGRRISLTDKYAGPDLVVRGIVDRTEIHSLFDLFHKHINPFAGLLDPRIHTPEATYSRSPSLFTMVCTLAIRYSPRVERFALAMHQAKKLAAEALVDGWKAAELAQVYILLGMYPAPSRKVEEDRTLLYSGIAQRVISDLNLSTGTERVPRDGAEALEFANYRRLCRVSFVLEKQAAIAYGKQAVQSDAPLIDDSSDGFFSSTAANSPFDIHLVAQVAIMQKLDLFRQEIITSLKVHITPELSRRYDIKLVETSSQWIERCQHHLNQSDDASVFRCKIQQYYLASARLVVSLLILQRASPLGSQITDEDSLWRCFNIARDIIHIVTELLAPTGYLRYAPDLFFVYSAFAAATLLSLIAQGRSQIDRNQSQVAYDSVNKLITTFNSTSVAIDEQHTPYIYSKLLTSLLDQCRADVDLPLEMIPQANSLNEVPNDWSSLFMSSSWILPSSPSLSSGYNVSPSMYPQTLQRDPSIPTVM